MRRRHLAVALLLEMLLVVALPLGAKVSELSADGDSFSESIRTLCVDRAEAGKLLSGYVSGEVVVRFGSEASEEEIVGLRAGLGAAEMYVSPFTFVRVWRVPPSRTVEDWVSLLGRHPLVKYAEPNYHVYASWVPNDPLYSYQWHFDDDHTNNLGGASSNPYGGLNGGGIGMEEVWAVTSGSPDIVVAVIDTGVAYEDYAIPSYERGSVQRGVRNYQKAPDLADTSFWQNEDEIAGNGIDDDGNGFVDDVNGWDFVNNDAHPNDNNGHGTHVTGTIAQTTDNGLGVAGIAFSTTIMPIKVLDYDGEGSDVWVADGVYYAVDNGARIVNLSLGSSVPSTTLENAVAYAYSHGVVVVAASGNDGTESVDYPAAYDDYVIAVGATRYDETRAYYSDYGSSLDLVAPGGDLSVDQNGDGYGDGVLQQTFKPYTSLVDKANVTDWGYWFFEGTSMATPHVSGVAALFLALDSTLTPDQVRHALESTAENLGLPGRDDLYGWGLVDAWAAVQSVAPPPVPILVVRGTNDEIYYRVYNSSTSSWMDWYAVPEGATCDSPTAAVYSGRLYFVVRGMDGMSLWFSSVNLTDYSFSGWIGLSGATPSAPTLTLYGSKLILVARGFTNAVFYRSFDIASQTWDEWAAIPEGATCDSPAAAVLSSNLHIVVRGFSTVDVSGNNTLWHGIVNLTDGSFSGWAALSGETPSAPTLEASETLNNQYLVVQGIDDQIWINTLNGTTWEGWAALPDGATVSSPAAAVVVNELHLVVIGMDKFTLWHCYVNLDSLDQSSWTAISGTTPSAPKSTS